MDTNMPKATIVIGLGFGDEGKGQTTQALALDRRALLSVKFNGGPQAAHNVGVPVRGGKDRNHTFSQVGASAIHMFNVNNVPTRVHTFISKYSAFDPLTLAAELADLGKKGIHSPKVTVSPESPVLTPYHMAINLLNEFKRGSNRHGSVGIGFGVLMEDFEEGSAPVIQAKHLSDPYLLTEKLEEIQRYQLLKLYKSNHVGAGLEQILRVISTPPDVLARRMMQVRPNYEVKSEKEIFNQYSDSNIIFEGGQGVLLDRSYGFFPHVTRSVTTHKNAVELLKEAGLKHEVEIFGVIRTYHSRHGAGPFPSEQELPTLLAKSLDEFNVPSKMTGAMRFGYLDLDLLTYARQSVEADGGKLTGISITHLDTWAIFDKVVDSYQHSWGWLEGNPIKNFPVPDSSFRGLSPRVLVTTSPEFIKRNSVYKPNVRKQDLIRSIVNRVGLMDDDGRNFVAGSGKNCEDYKVGTLTDLLGEPVVYKPQ